MAAASAAHGRDGMTGPVCDHRSVGVLIRDTTGRYLMFERTRPPVGVAPVAGHVDRHGGPEQAARAEVAEEVGLRVTALIPVAAGWRPNRCRRPTGGAPAGHHWTIYRATAAGTPSPASEEARNVRWVTPGELQALTDRTAAHARGEIPAADFAAAPGLEPVWVEWLHALGLVGVTSGDLARIAALARRPPGLA